MNNERSYIKVRINEAGEITPATKQAFLNACSEFCGQEINICIIKNTAQRTKDQNKFFYGVIVPRISKITGHSEDETKDILQQMFLTVVTPTGKRVVLKTSQLTVAEFSELLNQCVNLLTKFFKVQLTSYELDNYERII